MRGVAESLVRARFLSVDRRPSRLSVRPSHTRNPRLDRSRYRHKFTTSAEFLVSRHEIS